MRLIIRPAAGTYPPKTTLQFNGANRIAITHFAAPSSGTATFNTSDLLKVLLMKVKGTVPTPPATQADLDKACSAITGRLPDVYTAAGVPLATAWGTFCSYCGTVLPGLAEVEHAVPKAPYPTYALSWENFLLACGPCNTQKSSIPDRATATPWTGKANPTEAELYSAIRTEHFCWPDLDSAAFLEMRPVLQAWDATNSKWVTIPNAQAMNTNNFLLTQDIATRTVTAQIADGSGGTANYTVRCAITDGGQAYATEMILLCGLNTCNTPDSTYDRRMYNRTVTWFHAITAVKHYEMAHGTPHQATFEKMLMMLAVGLGFYDIWIEMIWRHLDKATAKNFATLLNVDGFYPGSNIPEMFS